MIDPGSFKDATSSPVGDRFAIVWIGMPVVILRYAILAILGSVNGIGNDGGVFHAVFLVFLC